MNRDIANRTHPAITPDHLRRLAVVYLRQSTPEQVQKNTGSAQFQRSLAEVAHSYGWPDSQVHIIEEDLGRSGSSTQQRLGWQSLQTMIEAKEVGAVFVMNISRLSRQVLDFELFRLRAALHNVLLYIDGQFINPSDSNDAILTQMTAMLAQFENRKRAEIMRQARLAKAKKGEAVSRLPLGWIKGPDRKFDFDPEIKDSIQLVIDTFWATRSVYQTVKVLAKAGVQMPCRKDRQNYETKPTMQQVTKILTDPAYSGTYIYGKTRAQPGSSVPGGGGSKQIKIPEEQWIKIHDHHPAYLSQEQQEEIKSIVKSNSKKLRHPVTRMPSFTRGLLRCAVCGARLGMYYPSRNYRFQCSRAGRFAEKPCITFSGNELEQCILREVFKVLKAPPLEILKSALKASRHQAQTRLSSIASERERLRRQEQAAQERAELTRGGLPCLYFDALQKLENVFQEIKQFEQKISAEPTTAASDCSAEELDELCRISRDVPALWQHEAVTHEERKEILRCLIDHVSVAASKDRIDATILWRSGGATPIFMWRSPGRSNLIRELHAQKLTALKIRERLAAGKTSTGQVVNLSRDKLHKKLHAMGLKASRFSADYLSLRQEAAELYREGRSVEWIARHFNKKGYVSASGKPWTAGMVYRQTRAIGVKPESFDNIHYRVIADARKRKLSYKEMANEFNTNKIRRSGFQTWTVRNVRTRWTTLSQLEGNHNKQEFSAAVSDASDLRRSA